MRFHPRLSPRSRTIGSAVPIVATLLLTSVPLRAADLDELLARGEARLRDGLPTRALKAFGRADRESEGGSFAAAAGLARAHLALGDHAEALSAATRAHGLVGDDPALAAAAWELIGRVHLGHAKAFLAVGAPGPKIGGIGGGVQAEEAEDPSRPPREVAGESLGRAVRALELALEEGDRDAVGPRLALTEALLLDERYDDSLEALAPLPPAEDLPRPAAEAVRCLERLARTARDAVQITAAGGAGDAARNRPLVNPIPRHPGAPAPPTGGVVLWSVRNEEGRIVCPLVLTASHPLFVPPAREALAEWRFEPVEADGRPVPAHYWVTFSFRR